MLDILTIVHDCADTQTAARIRCTCRRLAVLMPQPIFYSKPDYETIYEYRVGGKLHRLDGPAIVNRSGGETWYRGGIKHREYHPCAVGTSFAYYVVDDMFHREVGPSIIRLIDKRWYMRGRTHRKAGPAINFGGMEKWYTSGEVHRLDAPVYHDIYAIRGIHHRISGSMSNKWIVNNSFIR